MKALIAIILSLQISYLTFPQDTGKLIINDAMRRLQDTGVLIYSKAELSYSGTEDAIMKGKLYGGDEETRMNTLKLTKADKDVVLEKLERARSIRWADSLFENSRAIRDDSLMAILNDKDRGWPYFHKNLGKGFFIFSEPLFIRNSSYALLTVVQMVGNSAGYRLLFVYKKEGNSWKRYIMMVLGVW